MLPVHSRESFLRSAKRLLLVGASSGRPVRFERGTARFVPSRVGIVRPRQSSLSLSWAAIRTFSSPTSNAFWRDLNLAVKQGNGEEAEEIVNGLVKQYRQDESSSARLDTRIFSLVLEAWKNSDSSSTMTPFAPQRAQQLLELMIALADEGILSAPPSMEDYHAVLECWVDCASNDASLQAAESALKITKRMMNDYAPTEDTYLLVLQILANGGHAGSARQFIDTISEHNIPATIEMYNLVLLAFLRSTLPDAATQAQALLEELQSTSSKKEEPSSLPEPNSTSYDLAIQCWAENPQSSLDPQAGQQAQRLLSQMKSQAKIQTTLVSYQNVISILAQQGEAKQAERLLHNLVKDYGVQFDAQLKPVLAPFEAVLLAYSKSFYEDAAPRAESLLTHMIELYQTGLLERPPDVWSYNIVLKCWMHFNNKAQAAQRALALLDQMSADGVAPDTSTMNSVLNVMAQQKEDPLQAEQFLWTFYQSYLEDPIRNPQPDVISFGTVLKAWSRSKDPEASERAESLLLKLHNLYESGWDRCQPDHAIYSAVMKCYGASKHKDAPHKAEAILRSMQQTTKDHQNPSLKPDTVCWNMAIHAWAHAGQGPRAEALFKEMLQDYLDDPETGAAPNNITFSAVLSAWAKTQHNPQAPERAEALLQQMKRLAENNRLPDIRPNVVSYSIVLDCLAYAKTSAAASRAESILREMQASDDPSVQPNVISYNSVIKAWSLSRDSNALVKVTALLKEMMHEFEHHGKKQTAPNANTFGSLLKVVADSDVPDKVKRAQDIADLMEKFRIPWNSWSRNQWKRCHADSSSSRGTNAASRGRRRRGGGAVKKADDLPDIPDLKYS